MAMRPGPPRQPVGSAAWCAEERSTALQVSRSEIEEFSYSARNEMEWLNEHMAGIFSENKINVADVFKTPGKLRGKTPRTVRKPAQNENRVPLSDLFSSTPKDAPNPFTTSSSHHSKAPKFRIAEDEPVNLANHASATPKQVPAQFTTQNPVPIADSGYYGNQNQDATIQIDDTMEDVEQIRLPSPERIPEPATQNATDATETQPIEKPSSATNSFEKAIESEKEEQSKATKPVSPKTAVVEDADTAMVPASSPINLLGPESPEQSPTKTSPPGSPSVQPHAPAIEGKVEEPVEEPIEEPVQQPVDEPAPDPTTVEEHEADVTRSPSDGSSPIRPLVRKSSMNFASLPAREPLTSNKSLGARMSRTSHIDQTRTSYFPRHTGGKSLGVRHEPHEDEHDAMDLDVDDEDDGENGGTGKVNKESNVAAHSKTYTQRLQDQISMLGKSQASGTRLSKSIPNLTGTRQSLLTAQPHISQSTQHVVEEKTQLPPREQHLAKTPGAFPNDDEDDWIAPPTKKEAAAQSPRPAVEKSYSADIMEGVHEKGTISGADFDLPHHRTNTNPAGRSQSPRIPAKASEATSSFFGHTKSVSVPDVPRRELLDGAAGADKLRKVMSVSNPGDKAQVFGTNRRSKSPARSFCESPLKHSALKQVKNKFSSIIKGSKGLLASSAALSAESKASIVNSPSTIRLGKQLANLTESLQPSKEAEPLYPDLTQHISSDSQPVPTSSSPIRSNSRRTRASTERDRKEQKQKEREEKEAQHLAVQMDKLEKEREKERERARVFSQEQERIAAEKQLAAQKEHEKAMRTPAPKHAAKEARTSPRKVKTQQETEAKAPSGAAEPGVGEEDIDMTDAPASKPAPPSIARPTPGQTLKSREIKRPMKPTREAVAKPRQAPTLIRVNTSSQHTGFHPSNSALSATLQDTLGTSQQHLKSKASQPSLQTKTSQQSFSSSVNSTTGRPKALDLAAKRKQQEEREAQRKRDAKADMERKRAAIREEERRQEQERREKERQQAAAEEESKKRAQRQAAIEKAKQTRAPPPPVRSQPNGPPEYNSVREKASIPRPPSRLQSTMHRSQEDVGRPVNAVLSSTAKMSLKRPLQQESTDDGTQRPTASRNGQPQQKDAKRMRMSDEFNLEEEMEIQSYGTKIKGPPIRPSAGYKKDLPNKSLYASGYAPAPQSATRDIFKAPVAPQHHKSVHPHELAQVSKAHIPFASSHHAAGAVHKTPARPAGVKATKSAAKSAARSSPRFQNGENIELPEIQTDDEDDEDEEEDKGLGKASWADTPALRRELMRQETVDPLQVFGPPAPLNMEEVFSKSKDRWHKFRARTSSANWSGADRLTEEEIRKDLAARDRMRREGGWTYELSRDMS
ncbi:Inner centromere protein-related protein pic1 [Cytospora mali]|uniref:Inner centromere protein-related protein pic1 n=1 Tax=Cytospora mali TaxID=578113 RepID=A0A194V8L5_CYTMA|nr:Inner centromere protein-related protein pic1 [Valsa mali var. pyri (nom. inval.)]